MFTTVKSSSEHIDTIINLRLEMLEELGEITSPHEKLVLESSTRAYLQKAFSNDDFICYIAETDGKPVSISGMVFFHRPPYLDNLEGIEAYILNMYTLPVFRGNGLAKSLLNECITESKKRGAKRIWLHASESGALLYKKMGFKYKNNEMELFL